MELELATEELKQAKAATAPVADEEPLQIERSYLAASEAVSTTRILWVDDAPANNSQERRFLRSAGATVVKTLTTAEALAALSRDDYDIGITDRGRPESPQAGPELAETIAAGPWNVTVVGYTGTEPTQIPDDFFRPTSRPGELIGLVLAAIETRG